MDSRIGRWNRQQRNEAHRPEHLPPRRQSALDRLHDRQASRAAALEVAAEYCSDTAVVFWTVTTHTGIPRELRADLKAAIDLLRKIRTGVRTAAERGRR